MIALMQLVVVVIGGTISIALFAAGIHLFFDIPVRGWD